MSKYDLLGGLLAVMITSGLVGGHFGYTVNGVPYGGTIAEGTPGILGLVEWVWNGIYFMFQMVTFRIDGMPVGVNCVFIVMSLLSIFLIVSLIRGVH